MKVRWRYLIPLLLMVALVVGSLLYPALILNAVINPITRGLWLVARLLRAIDQKIYWGLLAIVVFAFGMIMLPRETERSDQADAPDAVKQKDPVAEWEQLFAEAGESDIRRDTLQRRLNNLNQTINRLVRNNGEQEIVLPAGAKRWRNSTLAESMAPILRRFLPAGKYPSHFEYQNCIDSHLSALETILEIPNDHSPDEPNER